MVATLGLFAGLRPWAGATDSPAPGQSSGGGAGSTGGGSGGSAGSTGEESSTGASGSEDAASDAPSGETEGETGGAPGIDPTVSELLAIAQERSFDVFGLEGLVSEDFYQVDINRIDPDVATEQWWLKLTGAVETEREFVYEDITSMPAEHRFITLRCVGEKLNGKKMDTALWTGVPIMDVLGDDLPDECCVRLHAADGYYQVFPLAALRNGFLAYRMNGKPLPRGHGHPVRVLIPGHWGEINVKWLIEIEVLKQSAQGYWEQRGWHGTGPVNTVAKLHAVNHPAPGRVELGGHAYAGTRGIDRVEVSIDGGETWNEAELTDPLPGKIPVGADAREAIEGAGEAEDAWRMWRYTYEGDGVNEVVVRAVDGTGEVQPREERRAFPSGATGWVSTSVMAS